MFVKQFKMGGDRNFGYLAADDSTRHAIVVDPAYSPEIIIKLPTLGSGMNFE